MTSIAEADSSGFTQPPPKPVYFGDMDEVLRRLADNVPFIDTERIYLWELDTQQRAYIALMALGLVMGALSFLLRLGG